MLRAQAPGVVGRARRGGIRGHRLAARRTRRRRPQREHLQHALRQQRVVRGVSGPPRDQGGVAEPHQVRFLCPHRKPLCAGPWRLQGDAMPRRCLRKAARRRAERTHALLRRAAPHDGSAWRARGFLSVFLSRPNLTRIPWVRTKAATLRSSLKRFRYCCNTT